MRNVSSPTGCYLKYMHRKGFPLQYITIFYVENYFMICIDPTTLVTFLPVDVVAPVQSTLLVNDSLAAGHTWVWSVVSLPWPCRFPHPGWMSRCVFELPTQGYGHIYIHGSGYGIMPTEVARQSDVSDEW